MSLNNLREKLNILLYDSKEKVLRNMRILSVIVSVFTLGTLVYYYGYEQTLESKEQLLWIIKGSFVFYILQYLTRFIYDFHPKAFLRRTWFEAFMIAVLIVEGVANFFFDTLLIHSLFVELGFKSFTEFSTVFIQLYFLIIMMVKISRTRNILPKLRLHPASLFMLSFLMLILIGCGLLMLPAMTHNGIGFIDALFTSTSATCVTGLMTESIHEFTFRGQVVILILIKLGGLNIIAFGSFLALASRFGLGVRHHDVIEDFVNKDSFLSARGLLGRIILWSVLIEVIGTVLIYFNWLPEIVFENTGQKMFSSVFHSVSAFNNAGISLFDEGMNDALVRNNYAIHIIIGVLIFLGALGFNAIFDIFGLRQVRQRVRKSWKSIALSSKIALYFSLIFVIGGMVAFLFLENDNTLQGEDGFAAVVSGFFQSVNRTSGFATVDYHEVGVPFLLIMIFLMFVGASSSSTGGGIKTSTFAVIWATIGSVIRGRKHVQLYKKTISQPLIMRAFSVLIFFLFGNLVCIILLSITEGHIIEQADRGVIDLIFEEVSALGTVGLSTGITPELSNAGKIIIIISMFVGRVGTLTVAFGLGKAVISRDYQYPQGHTMIG